MMFYSTVDPGDHGLSSPESLPSDVPAKHAVTSKSSEVHPFPADSVSSCSLLMKGAHHLAAVPRADRLLSAGVPAQSKLGLESCHPLRPFASRLRGVVKTRH